MPLIPNNTENPTSCGLSISVLLFMEPPASSSLAPNLHLYVLLSRPIPTQCNHLPSWPIPKSSQCGWGKPLVGGPSTMFLSTLPQGRSPKEVPPWSFYFISLHSYPPPNILHQRSRPPGLAKSAGCHPMLVSWSLSIVAVLLPPCSHPSLSRIPTML